MWWRKMREEIMQWNESEQAPHVSPKKGVLRRLFHWVEKLKAELLQVSWTSRAELVLSTKVVIVATFVFGFAIYCVDWVIKGALDGVGALARGLLG
jgi:preprotein translocase SecE subunit